MTTAGRVGHCEGCMQFLPIERLSDRWLCLDGHDSCERRVALSDLEHTAALLGDEHPETQRARERARRAEGL